MANKKKRKLPNAQRCIKRLKIEEGNSTCTLESWDEKEKMTSGISNDLDLKNWMHGEIHEVFVNKLSAIETEELEEDPPINTSNEIEIEKDQNSTEFYHCHFCSHKSSNKSYLVDHITKTHSHPRLDERGYGSCKACGKKYKGLTSLQTHEKICGKPKHLHCKYCPYKISYQFHMKNHILAKHKRINKSKVDDIVRDIVRKGDELLKNTALKPTRGTEASARKKPAGVRHMILFYCPKCDEALSPEGLKEFTECKKCGTSRLKQCRSCGERFDSHSKIRDHLRKASGACMITESLKCNDCDYRTMFKEKLKRHMNHVHTIVDKKNYLKCNTCDKSYKDMACLKAHKRKCGLSKKLKCEFCSFYETGTLINLLGHIKYHHLVTNNGDVVAVDEYKSFTDYWSSTEELKRHAERLIMVHCTNCNITSRARLRRNVYLRKCPKCYGPANYRCGEKSCKRIFSGVKIFHFHLNNHIPKEQRLYRCSVCNDVLINEQDLRAHNKICYMNQTVRCNNCKFRYKYGDWLTWFADNCKAKTLSPSHKCARKGHKRKLKKRQTKRSNGSK